MGTAMIDTQIANFFSNLTLDVDTFLSDWKHLEDRFQEAFDRDIDIALATLDFTEYGDLDYLTEAKINAAFAAYTALKSVMDASARQNWTRLYGIVK
jgi:hypothetical protein